MDENEQVAKDVEKSVLKLSDLIEYSKVQSALIGGENLKARINEIERFAILYTFGTMW